MIIARLVDVSSGIAIMVVHGQAASFLTPTTFPHFPSLSLTFPHFPSLSLTFPHTHAFLQGSPPEHRCITGGLHVSQLAVPRYKNRLHGPTNESTWLRSQEGDSRKNTQALALALCWWRTRKPKLQLLLFPETHSAFIQPTPRPAWVAASRLRCVLHQHRVFDECIPKQCCIQHVQNLEPVSKEALLCTKPTSPSHRHVSRVSFFWA